MAYFRIFICFLFSSSLLFLFPHQTVGSRVTILSNGYRDMVVGISPNVPQDQAATIIQNIQNLLTDASAALYSASRKRSYINAVRILIPDSWTNIPANDTTWEIFDDAEVQIDRPNAQYADEPYTLQLGGCSDQGKYIHLTPNYLLTINSNNNINKYGPPAKRFIREWARLRYGVFEEHGYPIQDTPYPMFYRQSNSPLSPVKSVGPLVPNICADKPTLFTVDAGCSVDPVTDLYNYDCAYELKSQFDPDSSLLSDYKMLDITTSFCDDDSNSHLHNREGPTKHNAMCNSRSVWSVVSDHPDFAGNNNPPADIADTKPIFKIVRCSAARYMLVLDISGSMQDYDRIGRLNEAARRWIKYDVPDGTLLGIVQFSTSSTLLIGLTLVSDSSRDLLMSKVPSVANGNTCIGCGLNAALKELSDEQGGVIVLLTDGVENTAPYIADVYPALIEAEVRVVSIAFGTEAENKIEDLATVTNGLSFFISDGGSNDELNSAFSGSLIYSGCSSPEEQPRILLEEQKFQGVGQTITGEVSLDFTLGLELTFRVDYTTKSHVRTFSVKSPTGQEYSDITYDDSTNQLFITIPNIAEDGQWSYTITVTSSATDYINLIVTSKPKSTSTEPVTAECLVPSGTVVPNAALNPIQIVAIVKRGRNAVINADVKAFIEGSDGVTQVVNLVDLGVGADTNKQDGIYSRYFVSATSVGRYTLRCFVNSTSSTYIADGKQNQMRTAIGYLNRVASGGAFRVEKPVPVNTDVYPPNRVTDLRVVAVQVDARTMTIVWTAPGDDLDTGRASSYEIKYSPVFDDLLNDKFPSNSAIQFTPQDVTDGSYTPLEAGSKQSVTLRMPQESRNATYFIALRAIDKTKLASDSSNIVSVQLSFGNETIFFCPGEGFFPISPDACSNKYYTCLNGQAYLSDCPGDSIFNSAITACVPREQAGCTPDFDCPADGFFALGPGGCFRQYWTCVRGTAYISDCPGTAVFDPSLPACVPIEISSCAPVTTTAPTTESTTSPTTASTVSQETTLSSVVTESTTVTVTQSTTVIPLTTPGGGFTCGLDGLYPNPNDCHSFYYCIGGVPYPQNCPAGLVFNPRLEVCDYPQNVPDNPCKFAVSAWSFRNFLFLI